MRDFERYTISNVEVFYDLLGDETFANEPGDHQGWWDEVVAAAGFDPEDEEVIICELSHDWNGHKQGSLLVAGLAVIGHHFAVEK